MQDSLIHYGIPGMKWGVRRFQNEDGSLTEIGKKKLSAASSSGHKAGKAISDLSKIGTGSKSKTIKKDYSSLTDNELKERVNRLTLEANYGRLTGDTKTVRSGADWAHEILQDVGIIVGVGASSVGIYTALKTAKHLANT